MRTTPRPRHHINPVAFALLRPVLRFSYTREAYVLRVVGNHRGPVFVRARAVDQAASADPADPGRAAAEPRTTPDAPAEQRHGMRAD